MEVGRKAVELPAEGEAALLLELCVCPPGTAGHSCQVGNLQFTLCPGICSLTTILHGVATQEHPQLGF